jgi:hypothetical protein
MTCRRVTQRAATRCDHDCDQGTGQDERGSETDSDERRQLQVPLPLAGGVGSSESQLLVEGRQGIVSITCAVAVTASVPCVRAADDPHDLSGSLW